MSKSQAAAASPGDAKKGAGEFIYVRSPNYDEGPTLPSSGSSQDTATA